MTVWGAICLQYESNFVTLLAPYFDHTTVVKAHDYDCNESERETNREMPAEVVNSSDVDLHIWMAHRYAFIGHQLMNTMKKFPEVF